MDKLKGKKTEENYQCKPYIGFKGRPRKKGGNKKTTYTQKTKTKRRKNKNKTKTKNARRTLTMREKGTNVLFIVRLTVTIYIPPAVSGLYSKAINYIPWRTEYIAESQRGSGKRPNHPTPPNNNKKCDSATRTVSSRRVCRASVDFSGRPTDSLSLPLTKLLPHCARSSSLPNTLMYGYQL